MELGTNDEPCARLWYVAIVHVMSVCQIVTLQVDSICVSCPRETSVYDAIGDIVLDKALSVSIAACTVLEPVVDQQAKMTREWQLQ
jgi:hypothetical protein